MSYSRSFTKTIAIHYSGTVNYPASQNGGSVSFSGTEYEDVTVNVHVDTAPFDASVYHCNTSVGVLTGAVVATEAAQTASIRKNALKVGNTIIEGFFKTVRSEISQQIMELKNKIDATLLHLNALSKRCVDKQHQMEVDYNRLAERYLKIFEELNGELKNRIYELDKPVFVFKKESDTTTSRFMGSDLVSTVAVSGAENGQLEALISASVAKNLALNSIGKVNQFLGKQKRTNQVLNDCIIKENCSAVYYIPVCYVEMNSENNRIDRQIHQPVNMYQMDKNELTDCFKNYNWKHLSQQDAEQIRLHFNAEVGAHCSTSNIHDNRVKDCILRLFNINTIQMI